jgi:hypothetical protein
MKFYVCTYYSPLDGVVITWHTSKKEANTEARSIRGEDPAVFAVNVPTKKKELLRWLNENVTSD